VKNFGKFSPVEEAVLDGERLVKYYVQRNGAGEDLVEVLKAHPHPFYIAVDKDGVIVSMESDPEQIQIPKYEIIGIDSNYGYTTREDGTVYGKIWNGQAIVEPETRDAPMRS